MFTLGERGRGSNGGGRGNNNMHTHANSIFVKKPTPDSGGERITRCTADV